MNNAKAITSDVGIRPLNKFLRANSAPIGSIAIFVVMMLVFMIASPAVFTSWPIYSSALIGIPILIFLAIPLVFIVTVGEFDLSFPAIFGVAAWVFALVFVSVGNPLLAFVAAIVVGTLIGTLVGCLIVYGNLSALVASLGMNFMLRGLILIITEGKSIDATAMRETVLAQVLAGEFLGIPAQVFWAVGFTIFATLLYTRHRFGVHVHCVGDNPDSAAQMGINVRRVRLLTFAFMGFGAALAGIFSVTINFTWWPTAGEGYLLQTIAAVFVGGTPTWGGIGTVLGGAVGASIVSFIQAGVVAAGLSGFYVPFLEGLILILALLGHRFNQIRYR